MKIDCAQCGGEIEVSQSDTFVRCGFCDSALYVDLSRTFLNQIIRPVVPENNAGLLVSREFEKRDVRGLTIEQTILRYVPFWQIDAAGESHWIIAAAVTDAEIARLRRISGTREILHPEDAQGLGLEPIDVPLEAVVNGMTHRGELAGEPDRVMMVYVPVYEVRWRLGEATGAAFVDATGGRVYDDDPPAASVYRLDRRVGRWMAAALGVFFVETALLGAAWGAVATATTATLVYFAARGRVGGTDDD